ncbi:hypothetical protein BGZ99_003864 [Dissophora globulifera]|uniref:Uncharacterized protein n=1 Tax=Dissophora globulifera TaxID=979702 RepID=A0A9P6RJB1_9FUNG|nr:hypothetical protein BGZ99_003864 [Dissophora globulifera]
MSAKSPSFAVATAAFSLSALSLTEALTLRQATDYLTQGLAPILSTIALTKRMSSSGLHKRNDVCSTYECGFDVCYYYCKSPTHCTGLNTCSFNFTWIIVVIVVLLVLICAVIIRRRRLAQQNALADANGQVVMTTLPAPQPEAFNQSSAYQPQMSYVPEPQTYVASGEPYDPNQQSFLPGHTQSASAGYQPVPTSYPPDQYQAPAPAPSSYQTVYSPPPQQQQQLLQPAQTPYMTAAPSPAIPYSPYPSEQHTTAGAVYSPYQSEHSQPIQPSPQPPQQYIASTGAVPQPQQQYIASQGAAPQYHYANPAVNTTDQPVGTSATGTSGPRQPQQLY